MGDILDRGPQSAEMLIWAVDEAPENVHFLMGNHEDMAYAVLRYDTNAYTEQSPHPYQRSWGTGWGSGFDPWDEPWSWNGGPDTMAELVGRTSQEWRRNSLCEWLRDLPNYYIVDDWLLVHAGLGFGQLRLHDDVYDKGRNEWVKIPNLENEEFSQHLIWIRYSWLCNYKEIPYNVAFGHTPTSVDWMDAVKDYMQDKGIEIYGEPSRIVTLSGYNNGKCRVCLDTGKEVMGILRLDDMQEFYINESDERTE